MTDSAKVPIPLLEVLPGYRRQLLQASDLALLGFTLIDFWEFPWPMFLAHPGDSPGSSCLSQYSPSWEQEGPGRGGWKERVLAFPNDSSEVHGAGVQASFLSRSLPSGYL